MANEQAGYLMVCNGRVYSLLLFGVLCTGGGGRLLFVAITARFAFGCNNNTSYYNSCVLNIELNLGFILLYSPTIGEVESGCQTFID